MKKISGLAIAVILNCTTCFAQDTVARVVAYDPHLHKLLPDKVFEIGMPLLFLLLLLNTIATVLKNRADARLKMAMVERGASEETLRKIFSDGHSYVLLKLQPLKYFLYGLALGLSFIIIHFGSAYFENRGGYFPLGIILLLTSGASYLYYRILQQKL